MRMWLQKFKNTKNKNARVCFFVYNYNFYQNIRLRFWLENDRSINQNNRRNKDNYNLQNDLSLFIIDVLNSLFGFLTFTGPPCTYIGNV